MWIFSRVKNLILLIQQRRKKIEVSKQKNIKKISKSKTNPFDFSQKISFSFLLKFWLAGVIVFYISYILFQSLNIIYLILTAFIISIAMESIISLFQKFIFNRTLAILLSYISLFTFLVM
jgi:predicted PurR-regulated permease PerM